MLQGSHTVPVTVLPQVLSDRKKHMLPRETGKRSLLNLFSSLYIVVTLLFWLMVQSYFSSVKKYLLSTGVLLVRIFY